MNSWGRYLCGQSILVKENESTPKIPKRKVECMVTTKKSFKLSTQSSLAVDIVEHNEDGSIHINELKDIKRDYCRKVMRDTTKEMELEDQNKIQGHDEDEYQDQDQRLVQNKELEQASELLRMWDYDMSIVLVSERVVEYFPFIIHAINDWTKTRCVDIFYIRPPIDLIIKPRIGISILDPNIYHNKSNLLLFIKELVAQIKKFDTIWILLCEGSSAGSHKDLEAKIRLMHATSSSSLPCCIYVRIVSEIAFDQTMMEYIGMAYQQATADEERSPVLSYYDYDTLCHNHHFKAQCEFLEMFPTLDIFTAFNVLNSSESLESICLSKSSANVYIDEEFHSLVTTKW